MLGGFSVGKTSLVKRYVHSVFSETYLTTVGVKIDKKTVTLSDRIVNLILWDLAGEDDINSLRMTNLRGAAGYVLVADGTRPSTSRSRFLCASGSRPITVRCRSCCS
jgi:GTPase SAR1 family protein